MYCATYELLFITTYLFHIGFLRIISCTIVNEVLHTLSDGGTKNVSAVVLFHVK